MTVLRNTRAISTGRDEDVVGARQTSATWLRLAAVALLAAGLTGGAQAGSTGDTGAFLRPQGEGAPSFQGDDVSSNTGGISQPYHYWIEVPSTATALVVEIFDADVGIGGLGEDTATPRRDRARPAGGPVFESQTTYELFAPNGLGVQERFTLGDIDEPALSDNAWLTFFNSGFNVRDEFNAVAYNNSNGTSPWATNWIETGDNANPASGDIAIVADAGSNRLRVQSATNSVEREANLNGVTTATLTFVRRRVGLDAAGDNVVVQASANGGGAWTTLATYAGPTNDAGYVSESFNISAFIATNTRVRFLTSGGMDATDQVFFDNVDITTSGAVDGHWEVRIDMAGGGADNDDINALGLRASDGNTGSGGVELNIYADSATPYGMNAATDADNNEFQSHDFYPYVTAGCTASKNDFDYDDNSGSTGSMTFTSRTSLFTQSYGDTQFSTNDDWRRDTFGPGTWLDDDRATDYGIWHLVAGIEEYPNNSNYTVIYIGRFDVDGTDDMEENPETGTFRIYLPRDGGGAPVKPYLEQLLTHTGCGGGNNGPNPPQVGQTSCFTVTVRMVNPTPHPIVFSSPTNIVTATVPSASVVTYFDNAQVSQGSILSQPVLNGTGDITWTPNTVASGATALLSYRIRVAPTGATPSGTRIIVTPNPSGTIAGTRGQYVDETGNTTQTRATYLSGPLCALAVTVNNLTTRALVTDVEANAGTEGTVVSWKTSSEDGAAAFRLLRMDTASSAWVEVGKGVSALVGAPQGGTYRVVDSSGTLAAGSRQWFSIVERDVHGKEQSYGPFAVIVGAAAAQRAGNPLAAEPHGLSVREATRLADSRAAAIGGMTHTSANAVDRKSLKLGVNADGVYAVTAVDIGAMLGMQPAAASELLRLRSLALSAQGAEVPYIVAADNSALFFYGEAGNNVFGLDNVYRLTRGRGAPMAIREVRPPAAAGVQVAQASAHVEQDRFAATVLALDAESDYWFWDYLEAPGRSSVLLPLALPGAAPTSSATTTVAVDLLGATTFGVEGEHAVEVRLNGAVLGITTWSGLGAHRAEWTVSADLLRATGNEVELVAVASSAPAPTVVFLQDFDVSYPRFLTADNGQLAIQHPGQQSLSQVTVSGFSSSRIAVLELAEGQSPRVPVLLNGPAIESAGKGSWVARLRVQLGRDYHLADLGNPRGPAWMAVDTTSNLRGASGADLLIITVPQLRSAAERLADLREAGGLSVAVVEIEDVYDEFAGGVRDPRAIRDLMTWALAQWPVAPRYLLLFGDGTLDYRDLLGLGDNLVPALMRTTASGLYSSDQSFADIDGDGQPEVAVGRAPVGTPAEAEAFVDKQVTLDSAAGADWTRRLTAVADNLDGGTDFGATNDDTFAGLPPGFELEKLYLNNPSGAPALRQAIIQAFTGGRLLVAYTGHGGLDRWAAEPLLTSADAPILSNATTPTLVTAMTCSVNRFELPGFTSLGEALVRREGGGAAAVWSASGLSIHAAASRLQEIFFHNWLNGSFNQQRLGDLIVQAQAQARAGVADPFSYVTYNLLGDPSLRIPPQPVPPTSGDPGGNE